MSRDHEARIWLQEELKRRSRKNPLFSLRAFARQLEMSPGRLSEILSGRRRITPKMARKLCDRILVNPSERNRILRTLDVKASAHAGAGYSPIPEDQFELVAGWEHYAILVLAETADFVTDPLWIGKRLGISPVLARSALDRLVRQGLLKKEDERLVPTHENVTTTHDVPSAVLKKAHEEDLRRAIGALYDVPVEERDITSITMAIDPSKLPIAKEMIRDFRRRLSAVLETGSRTEVYNLNVQLIPVTRRKGKSR